MARPTLPHDGFLIPNASVVTNPRMAEPDQVDFNTLAHARWGVLEGCLITASGATIQCSAGGLALVNSRLVTVSPQSRNIGIGGALDRFDLVVVDEGGSMLIVGGTPATDPVFPAVEPNVTVLAAVFIPTGTSNLADNVIDKRRFIMKSLLTKIAPTDMLLDNRNGSGSHFTVNGGGLFNWEADTLLQRSAPKTLRVTEKLVVDDTITAGGALQAASVTATPGLVTGANLHVGTVFPTTNVVGALFSLQPTGRLFIYRATGWEEIATISGAVPVGSVIQSVEPPEVMGPKGWISLEGQTINENQYPTLFALTSLQHLITAGTPRTMKLPDAANRVFRTSWASRPFSTGGLTDNKVTLALASMPKHNHNVTAVQHPGSALSTAITIGRAGSHSHSMPQGGAHTHTTTEHEHTHHGVDNYGSPAPIIAVAWGGRNKIDALFNDRNHTYSVEKGEWLMPARQQVDVNSTGSSHGHDINSSGDHTHSVSGNIPAHNHTVNEDDRGSSTPFDVTNAWVSIYSYIRT